METGKSAVDQLWSFVASLSRFKEENALNAKNMKRENKTYSYKEQMEELELKKELSKKKGLKGEDSKKLDMDGLTPKQKEIVRLELEKEDGIRLKLEEVRIKTVLIYP